MARTPIKRTTQEIQNWGFDETYNQPAFEILVENVAETALVRQKPIATEDTLQANTGKYSTIAVTDSGDSNLIYFGDVAVGSVGSTSQAIWRISRLDTTTLLTVTWAGGSKEFNQIWDSRESLIYS